MCLIAGLRLVHSDIKAHYDSLVAADQLKFDAHQVSVVKNLQTLQKTLQGYEPPRPGLLDKVYMYMYICTLLLQYV